MSKERPILFSTEMVQAILDGRKFMTRRVCNQDFRMQSAVNVWRGKDNVFDHIFQDDTGMLRECPYGKPGDLLYVRETWCIVSLKYRYRADGDWDTEELEAGEFAKWKHSIHMPKEASRIWLRVKDVRVERVQDITTNDIKAEGVQIPVANGQRPLIPMNSKYFPHKMIMGKSPVTADDYYRAFWVELWDSINAKRNEGRYSWEKNPWVWVISFEVISKTGKP